MNNFARFLPFLRWFPMNGDTIKADFMAGITVALVLIPQSMAYAQLAGLPAYYGLYAAFLPVAIAALWGSSNQLGTGPVAVVSLLTASSLAVFATPGSPDFVALAIMLALLVGIIQLLLGVFKLGVIVNFLSHPVIVGFTNAAAIIIALSQVSKLFGVPMGRSEHFINDIIGVFKQIGDTHLPTLAMGMTAIAIMWGIKKFVPKLPGVLIAVVLTTLVAWGIGFEKKATLHVDEVADPQIVAMLIEYETAEKQLASVNADALANDAEAKKLEKQTPRNEQFILALNYQADLLRSQAKVLEETNGKRLKELRKLKFEREVLADGKPGRLILAGPHPAIDCEDPGEAGFTGSLIVAEFPDLPTAQAWAAADPYALAGVYEQVEIKPFRKVFPA